MTQAPEATFAVSDDIGEVFSLDLRPDGTRALLMLAHNASGAAGKQRGL